MSKTVTWIIVVLIIIGGGWYFWSRQSAPATAPAAESGTATQNTDTAGQQGTGTSDQNISQDMNSVDTQVQAAGDAGASAQSFSDTPVTQ